MSAAEKLRTLDAKAVAPPWLASPDSSTKPVVFDLAYNDEDCEVIAALRNALPHILAVVEAAERQRDLSVAQIKRVNAWFDPPGNLATSNEIAAIWHALAALDEQLQDLSSATEPEAPTPR